MIERRLLRQADWVLVFATLALAAFGTLMIASASRALDDPTGRVPERVAHLVAGALAMVAAALVDYRALARHWRWLYGGSVVLLVAVLLVGRTVHGSQSWIGVGPLSFQPAELAKLAFVITLAQHLSLRKEPITRARELLPYVAHVAPLLALILLQPDLGTALVFLAILFGMLYAAGARWQVLVAMAAAGAAASPAAFAFLKDYQRARLLVFLNPGLDPRGAGYNLVQSKIAIGSGRLTGKGLFEGTQNFLQFVPERHTDFIFSVVGEELGFVGGIALLAAFLAWILRGLRAAAGARDELGTLMAAGIVSMVLFHLVVNVGMTMGLMPITGIPLSFVSHGGTALVVNMAAAGVLLSIGMRRRKILF